MEKFNKIYPFTTENIAGYMDNLDLTGKKIITVTGSSDHILNTILKGSKEITTFDINPLTKLYMELKLSAIKKLSYKEFLGFFLYDSSLSFDKQIISHLEMTDYSKKFWLEQLSLYKNNGIALKYSPLFNTKYFNPDSKKSHNLYLSYNGYIEVQRQIDNCHIKFINQSLQDLELQESYDYMFLSNISDYLDLIYRSNYLCQYRNLLNELLHQIKTIYFAYLYDIGNKNHRSDIDNLLKVKEVFKEFEIKEFKSALETKEQKKDGVLILRRN